jgi:tRNA(fMet)-specific endonuclease VapC
MYLVDTDWIVDYLKGKENAVKGLQKLFNKGLYISIVSIAKIYEGIIDSKNKENVKKSFDDFLSGVVTLNINESICKKFRELRSSMRKKGEIIGDFDILIASTAIVNDLKLVTNNTSHFNKIKEVEIFKP